MRHYKTASGYVIQQSGKARHVYNAAGKHLGTIIDRGNINHTPLRNDYYGNSFGGGHITSTEVHDIVGPTGGMLVKGCITGTLWAHVKEQLGKAA